eukprot:TRINITY_DN655_c0_g1_i4.p1 TRINITY_DN655_c0_g1~~TRINITY_DN655_c0_g1_i4.p1  ORF type:complete len:160 (+),score=19.46 TRINITY_DN655_c0_g1_i4:148-627(+)
MEPSTQQQWGEMFEIDTAQGDRILIVAIFRELREEKVPYTLGTFTVVWNNRKKPSVYKSEDVSSTEALNTSLEWRQDYFNRIRSAFRRTGRKCSFSFTDSDEDPTGKELVVLESVGKDAQVQLLRIRMTLRASISLYDVLAHDALNLCEKKNVSFDRLS